MTADNDMVERGQDRVTYTEDGQIDEIVGSRFAHLERMSKNRWFLEIGHADGTSTALWFKSKKLPSLIETRPPAKRFIDAALKREGE